MDASLKEMTLKYEEINRTLNDREILASRASFQLNKWDRKIMDIKLEIKSIEEVTTDLRDNIFIYETSIASASKEIQEHYDKVYKTDKVLKEWNAKIAAAEAVISELRLQDEEYSNNICTAAERIKQIEDLIDEEEKRLECFEKCLDTELIKKSQWFGQKVSLENKTLNIEHDIQSVFSNLQTMLARTKDTKMQVGQI